MVSSVVVRGVWGALRVALAVTWLVAAGAAWWTMPREATYEQAVADVAAHGVIGYRWGDSWHDGGAGRWFEPVDLESSGLTGPLFVWHTGDGRIRWADTGRFDRVTAVGTTDEQSYSGPAAAALARDLRAAGIEEGDIGTAPGTWAGVAGSALLVLALGFLVAGPAPVLGTRWYWFWLIIGPSFGLGMLFWLWRDRPWAPDPRPAAPEPAKRDRGLLGFGTALAASFVVSVLVLGLNWLLGDRWVPMPDG
ncbi:hypothetical protein [Actinoplanes sp. NPDC051494]|uniref:hypothetical protein n=1 Tax=Actinoplanes sp. NPDC051494 TaxID=3363907 RepID=UPI0037BC0F00